MSTRAEIDLIFDQPSRHQGAQLRHILKLGFAIDSAAAGPHHARPRLHGRQQFEFRASTFDKYLCARLFGIQVSHQPRSVRRFESHWSAHSDWNIVGIGEAKNHLHRGLAISGMAGLGYFHAQLAQSVRRNQLDQLRTALVAIRINLFDFDKVLAGLQIHAHEFPNLKLLICDRRFRANLLGRNFFGVDVQLERASHMALHADIGLRE